MHFNLLLSIPMYIVSKLKLWLLGIYGHSTVYHGPTDSLYVFGGYIYSVNQTIMTDKLFALNYEFQIWTILPIFKDYNPPKNSLVSNLFV